MVSDHIDCKLILLPEALLHEILDCLPLLDVFHGASLVCHRFNKMLRESEYLSILARKHLGLPKAAKDQLKLIRRELIRTALVQERLLLFEGQSTSGGCYHNQARYQLENMFDYSASVYITNAQAQNVLTRACFTGLFDDRTKFKEDIHEDLSWFSLGFEVPNKYRDALLLDDTYMSGKPVRRVAEVFHSNEFNRRGELWYLLNPAELRAQTRSTMHAALINRVGIGRPVFTAHPVRTLLLSTKLGTDTNDLKQFHGLDSLDKVKKCRLVKIETVTVRTDFTVVEFQGMEGPLLWIQFTDCQLLQVEVVLKMRRIAKALEVLLIDADDRKEEFGGVEKGITVSYVVTSGWTVATDLAA